MPCAMAESLEAEHVHKVYSQIASHFSDTRYKPWPRVAQFLLQLPPGSLVADVGCGNGKYFPVVGNHGYMIGCDMCRELLAIAATRGHEVAVADCLNLPYRNDSFDAAISVAVVHHLSNRSRRLQAVQELVRVVRRGGRVLVYVWAMEQQKRKFSEPDVMVPWHLQPRYASGAGTGNSEPAVGGRGSKKKPRKQRRARKKDHSGSGRVGREMAAAGESDCRRGSDECGVSGQDRERAQEGEEEWELAGLCLCEDEEEEGREEARTSLTAEPTCSTPVNSQYIDSIATGKPADETTPTSSAAPHCTTAPNSHMTSEQAIPSGDCVTPVENVPAGHVTLNSGHMTSVQATPTLAAQGYQTFHRYYHVFQKDELSALFNEVGGVRVVEEFYDHENWCVVAEKV